jgi:hypothetical protein
MGRTFLGSTRWIALLVVVFSAAASRALAEAAAPEVAEPASEIEPEAMELLMRSAAFIAKAQQLHFVTEVTYDVRQESGQLLEFGARRATSVRRPDRVRVEVQSRDGNQTLFLFDGKKVTLLDRDENVYATAERPGSIDDVLDFTLKELETPVPLAEMLYTRFPDLIREKVHSIYTVGEETLDGTRCQHLAARGDEVDAQFWIALGGEPVPRRVVLSYKQEEGQPQFRAQIADWSFASTGQDASFEFQPPEGAEAVPFLLHARETAPPDKKEGAP